MIRYFFRSYRAPGDNLPTLDGSTPNHAIMARAYYRVYPDVQAVVYTGIDRTIPTNAFSHRIIGMIAEREGLDPLAYSWFDLQTHMQDLTIASGELRYYAVLLKPGVTPIAGECAIIVECPTVVRNDFERYINSDKYADPTKYFAPDVTDDDKE